MADSRIPRLATDRLERDGREAERIGDAGDRHVQLRCARPAAIDGQVQRRFAQFAQRQFLARERAANIAVEDGGRSIGHGGTCQ